MKVRIIKRTYPDGNHDYVIQQKYWLLRWLWVDASINSVNAYCKDHFSTLEEAEENLCYFNGSKSHDEVIREL